jgi:flagellin
MALYVNTNVQSLNAQRNLLNSTMALGKAFERLSSGLRVNSAADDAAGLAIASRLGAQARGLTQAIRNANDGIGVIQTAEGGLQEITNILLRLKELAVQAANETNSSTDQASLDDEAQALLDEITRISDQTSFGTTNILDGSFNGDLQVGVNTGEVINVTIADSDATALGVNAVDLTTSANASTAMGLIDTALDTVNSARGDLGAIQNRLQATVANLSVVVEKVSDAKSRILDADFAAETANLTRAQILQQAGVSVLSQANVAPQAVLALLRA